MGIDGARGLIQSQEQAACPLSTLKEGVDSDFLFEWNKKQQKNHLVAVRVLLYTPNREPGRAFAPKYGFCSKKWTEHTAFFRKFPITHRLLK